jgi:hypothetical protein
VLGTDYHPDGVRIQVALPDSPETLAGFRERLAALTGGGPEPVPNGSRWVDRG